MVWSQLAGIRIPPIVTTDFLYIRFIGDRTIQENDFGEIQKDRVSEIKKWARSPKRVGEHYKLECLMFVKIVYPVIEDNNKIVYSSD